ncbi:cytochrome P450 [Panus rudis PR-1116 ss-1]|nr:cytochrome P450 [Panus rudis PR-1116 ss-1]
MSGYLNVVTFVLIAATAVLYLSGRAFATKTRSKLSHIPSITTTLPFFSTLAALRFVLNGREMIQEGYEKFKGGAFRIPELLWWRVIVTGPQMVEEMRKLPDDVLGVTEAHEEILQVDYTMSPAIRKNPYHIETIRNQLTKNVSVRFPDLQDEIVVSCNDLIPPTNDWSAVMILPAMMQVTCRAANRVFVGLPTCREPDYIDLNIQFTVETIKSAAILQMIPRRLKHFVARHFTNIHSNIRRGVKHLGPSIRARLASINKYGDDWPGKPNDMISWLLEGAEDEEREVPALVLRLLLLNLSAIHTSSITITHALLHLAANPAYLQPLREEIETVVAKDGWTRAGIQKMRKLDSFLMESSRLHGIGSVSLLRRAVQDFTFSNGTFVPAGTFISAASWPVHHDKEYYEDPDMFMPWRFAGGDDDSEGRTQQMTNTSRDYLTWGYGKHACPGRFFAVTELKAVLAHLIVHYDMKLEQEGVIPKDMVFSTAIVPDPEAKVLFRKRGL